MDPDQVRRTAKMMDSSIPKKMAPGGANQNQYSAATTSEDPRDLLKDILGPFNTELVEYVQGSVKGLTIYRRQI